MAHSDVYYARPFNMDMLPLDFDLKSGLLADVMLHPGDPETHCAPDHLRTRPRMDEFLGQDSSSQSPPFDSGDAEMWVPSCDDLDDPTSADSHATAPANVFQPMMMRSPAFQPPHMAAMSVYGLRSPDTRTHMMDMPVAAPMAAFPNMDAGVFKRVKLESDTAGSPSPIPTTPQPPSQQQQQQQQQQSMPLQQAPLTPMAMPQPMQPMQAPSTPQEMAAVLESPGTSARAARAASRGKRSPSSEEPEYIVPYSPTVRSADARRRKPERQSSRTTVEAQLSEEERLEKNRQSARDCRLRKKRYIESLERRLAEADKRESVLTATITRLEDQIAILMERA